MRITEIRPKTFLTLIISINSVEMRETTRLTTCSGKKVGIFFLTRQILTCSTKIVFYKKP